MAPAGDDGVTMPSSNQVRCADCGRSFPRHGRARFCSHACRQRSFRARHGAHSLPLFQLPRRTRDLTVFECPECEDRFLGQNRCESCNKFCRSLGYGLACSHCDEPLVLNEILSDLDLPLLPKVRT
jgi:hypothetical protein